jgi:hypothetical protein
MAEIWRLYWSGAGAGSSSGSANGSLANEPTISAQYASGSDIGRITPLVYQFRSDAAPTFHSGVWTGDDSGWQVVQAGFEDESPLTQAEFKITGGTPDQRLEVSRALDAARRRMDRAIELLDKNWESYVNENPDGALLTPILRDPAERAYWLDKLREARSLFDDPDPIRIKISPRGWGRNGAGDSSAEVNCWELFGSRWWSGTITVKPPFFDGQSSDSTREDVMSHELGRRVGIADGERGPHDNINLWDIIHRKAIDQ